MNDLSLVVGSNKLNSGGDLYTIKKMTPHEGFSRQTAKNDVGLIKINGKIAMKDNVKAIKLKKEAVAAGTKCTLTGWGYIDRNRRVPNNLQYLDFTTISNKECNQKLRDSQFTPISQKEVCGVRPNNKGMCQGDSGGPLVMTENNQVVQIGLVSWGRGCAYNFPDVFASVAGYYDWIVNNMK